MTRSAIQKLIAYWMNYCTNPIDDDVNSQTAAEYVEAYRWARAQKDLSQFSDDPDAVRALWIQATSPALPDPEKRYVPPDARLATCDQMIAQLLADFPHLRGDDANKALQCVGAYSWAKSNLSDTVIVPVNHSAMLDAYLRHVDDKLKTEPGE